MGGAGLPAARRQLAIECTSPSRAASLLTVNKFFDVSARLGAEAQRKVMGRLPRQRLSVHLMHNLGPAQVGTPVQHLPQVGSGGEMQLLAPEWRLARTKRASCTPADGIQCRRCLCSPESASAAAPRGPAWRAAAPRQHQSAAATASTPPYTTFASPAPPPSAAPAGLRWLHAGPAPPPPRRCPAGAAAGGGAPGQEQQLRRWTGIEHAWVPCPRRRLQLASPWPLLQNLQKPRPWQNPPAAPQRAWPAEPPGAASPAAHSESQE